MQEQDNTNRPAAMPQAAFGVGVEDAIILPLVAIALAVKKLLHLLLRLLIDLLDFAFPILLQLARFPLYTLRIVGDGLAALLRGIVAILPMSGTRRAAWREAVSRHWAWLRQKLSYKAFEEAVHHAFERGMSWVFRKCRGLSPNTALLLIFCAVLWLPISFGIATLLHAVLIAKALSLPPWMQLLHPLGTIIAKSKLLVLPVYPAAWPQAKKHPFVQALFQFWRSLTALYLLRKTGYRYRQTENAATEINAALGHATERTGVAALYRKLLAGLSAFNVWMGAVTRAAWSRLVAGASALPLAGPVVRSYAAHYEHAGPEHPQKLSEQVSGFFSRWSIKFSAEYYEAKDRAEAEREKHMAAGPPVSPEGAKQ